VVGYGDLYSALVLASVPGADVHRGRQCHAHDAEFSSFYCRGKRIVTLDPELLWIFLRMLIGVGAGAVIFYCGRWYQHTKTLSLFYHTYVANYTLYVRCRFCLQDVIDDGHDPECAFGKLMLSDRIQHKHDVCGNHE
jgi:hypothetical protein